jgi:tetratricopeptide (TPR) repeat protein
MTQTTLREYLRTTEDAISSGRIDEALANCQNVLTYFPEALEAQRLLGEVYLAQGQLDDAQRTFEWVLTNDPENVIVYCDRALISEQASDIDTALDCYQQAYELSRGNANIRQEFNQLSARAGQQEFMFSRAGLARLYMRGDLLTQAIQEWDAVLAINPDRLDARLGLMETYWRDGMYAKTEQLASQLLEEIPTCLKALLYLAHVTSIANISRARNLLQRAEALDPELTTAQEIFADLAARQPQDPFLELLKKEPILLEDGTPVNRQPAAAPEAPNSTAVASNGSASPYSNWDTLDNWNGQSPAASTPASAPVPETPPRTSWNDSAPGLSFGSPAESALSAWQEQTKSPAPPSPSQEAQPWYQNAALSADNASSPQHWNNRESANNWSNEAVEEEQAAPPAWLDTLTRNEQQMASGSAFSVPASPLPYSQPVVRPVQEESAPPISFQRSVEPIEEAAPFFFPTEEENEGEMGWPEWLKSLGAEELEPERPAQSEPLPEIDATPVRPLTIESSARELTQSAPEADPWAALPAMSANNEAWAISNSQPEWMQQSTSAESAPAQETTPDWMQQFSSANATPVQESTPDWMQQFASPQTQSATPDWMQQFASSEHPPYAVPSAATNTDTPADEQEQRYIASLADLENDLQSQGFVPLAPGSLASIASTQQSAPVQPPQADPLLSSALAQLGNYAQTPQAPAGSDPWWNTQGQAVAEQPVMPQAAEPFNPFTALGARTAEVAPQSFAPLPATPMPISSSASFAPGTSQDVSQGNSLTPTYRSDALLDSDLETTMKRPAITLQPMKPGTGALSQGDRAYTNGKGRGERKHSEHIDEGNLSNHERLVKGYQYQLNGAYEDAMQEYRLIIRNAPELLDDVISNMRALLKINPRFSLGYRVLGDAYMRKGEYLQAMESYNKALTMAKKTKN